MKAIRKVIVTAVAKVVVALAAAALAAGVLTTSASAAPERPAATPAAVTTSVTGGGHSMTPTRINGRWTWWGYRTNSYETWAIATQPSSSWVHWVPIFGQYIRWQAIVWRLTAQNARRMGQCIGITWSGSGIIVGCA
jgi:hypothetical protein